jgi:hypothetical protein
LLLSLKPKFNRAGTWPATPRFLVWRQDGENLELSVTEAPEIGWQQFGFMRSQAPCLRVVVVRLLWCAVHPDAGASQMPVGWNHGLMPNVTMIRCGILADEATGILDRLFAGHVDAFCEWVKVRRPNLHPPFEQAALAEDIEALGKMIPVSSQSNKSNPQNNLSNLRQPTLLSRCSPNP